MEIPILKNLGAELKF